MKINKFKPRSYLDIKNPSSLDELMPSYELSWTYATNGKSCIRHILRSLSIKHVLLPVYGCSSIIWAVKKESIKYSFYDHNIKDLNPSVSDINEKMKSDKSIDAVLIVSLYGNPAEYDQIKNILTDNIDRRIYIIDDAAQAFGAKYGEKSIGTFGDAGFMSFSPGKPTSGPIGAYFWTSNRKYSFFRSRHSLFRKIKWLLFKKTRYNIDEWQPNKAILYFSKVFEGLSARMLDVLNDRPEPFEVYMHRQILTANLDFSDRKKKLDELTKILGNSDYLSVINMSETANPYKLVMITNNYEVTINIIKFLSDNLIHVSSGYEPLDCNYELYPNIKSLHGRIIEVPIDDEEERHHYLKSVLYDWIANYEK